MLCLTLLLYIARLRLLQAERELGGNFRMSTDEKKRWDHINEQHQLHTHNTSKIDSKRIDDDDQSPAAILNRQHKNFVSQAKVDLKIKSYLNTAFGGSGES